MSTKNQYQAKATKASLLGAITETQQTEGDIKGSLIETGKDILIGVIGGGIVGSYIGKASLLVGAVITGAGHYTNNRLASMFGFGMMAANGFQTKKDGVSGTEDKGMLEGGKERVMAFKDTFSEKLFLDKLLKKKEAPVTPASGMGEVQYFTYPDDQNQLTGEVDLTVLDQIEQQVAQSAAAYRQEQMKGILPLEESMGDMLDPGDQNF